VGTLLGEVFSPSMRERLGQAGTSLVRSSDAALALCRGLECAVAGAGPGGRLYTCLPTLGLSADRRHHYRALAEQAALVTIWAAPADLATGSELSDLGDRVRIAPLEPEGPSAGSWFVLVNGPDDAAVLLADIESPPTSGPTTVRATLSAHPKLVGEIETHLREQVGLAPTTLHSTPAGDRPRSAALERVVDALTAELDDALTGQHRLLRERGEVSRLIAHDLKGPLGFITGMAELMLMDRYGELPEEVRGHLTEMIRQGDRAVELLDQVAIAHRLEAGDLRIRRADVDTRRLIEQAVAMTAAEAAEHGRRVVVRSGGGPVPASLDRRLVERTIAVLISHVLRNGAGEGDVTLDVDRQGRELLVDVRRERPGARPADLPDKTVRPAADDARTAPAREALDFRFCTLVAQAHGGSFVVESGVGGVAVCRVALPLG
jgi:signal transduction histidine kinase